MHYQGGPKSVPRHGFLPFNIMSISRREFLVTSAVTLGATSTIACASSQASIVSHPAPESGGVILFQGDSITDVHRDRTSTAANDLAGFGSGYPTLVSGALLGAGEGAHWRVYNRGISGNKVADLQARWSTDALALKPDILSILIGVNDFWHNRLSGYTGTTTEGYASQYLALLTQTRQALPQARIVILEPFAVQFQHVDASWFPEFDARRAVAATVAERVGATFIPLHDLFNRRAAETRPQDWVLDGVHPTLAGHALIAERWRAAVAI